VLTERYRGPLASDELAEKWGQRFPAVIRLWDNAWNEFIPFLDYAGSSPDVIASRTIP
jgi:putative transposase